MKNTGQLILAFLVVILGIGLLYVGLMTPPEGEIDASLLVAYGETLTFAGAIIGIDYKYKYYGKHNQHESNHDAS